MREFRKQEGFLTLTRPPCRGASDLQIDSGTLTKTMHVLFQQTFSLTGYIP